MLCMKNVAIGVALSLTSLFAGAMAAQTTGKTPGSTASAGSAAAVSGGRLISVEGHEAYMYSLLVETVEPKTARKQPGQTEAFQPADAAKDLQGTSSLVVSADMLTRFNAVEVPLLVVTDSAGVVRFISVVDEAALRPGNMVDSAVARVGAEWPESGGAGKQTAAQPVVPKSRR